MNGINIAKKRSGIIFFCQRGITLIEAVLTTVILSMALFGGMIVMQNASISSVERDLRTQAIYLAQEKIEIVLADTQSFGYNYITTANYPTETLSGSFNRTIQIFEVDKENLITPASNSGLKKINVTVNWGGQAYQTVIHSTLIANLE